MRFFQRKQQQKYGLFGVERERGVDGEGRRGEGGEHCVF